MVLTDLSLQSTLHKPNFSGRMARWAIELSEYNIQYKPRLSKKGQVLVDFIAEILWFKTYPENSNWWTLNVDGASRQTGVGISLQLKSPTGERIEQAIRLGFNTSNNESKYEALLSRIELAAVVSADKLLIQSYSQLVISQVNEDFESWDPRMEKYVSRLKQRLGSFSIWKLEHIPRDCNEKADALAMVAASLPIAETIFLPIYYQSFSSISPAPISQVEEVLLSWMDPIICYIDTGELPNEKDKAHKVRVQLARFSLIDGQLFKRSLGGPYLKCLTPK